MKKKITIIIFFIIILIAIMSTKSKAAISATSATVNSGETVTIRITSNPGVATYIVSLVNSGGLEFLSCSGGTVGGTTVADTQNKNMTSLATYHFRAPNVTTDTTYLVTFSGTGMETVDLQNIPSSTTTAKITVKAPENNNPPVDNPTNQEPPAEVPNNNQEQPSGKKSNNANLKDLGIRPNDFKGFNSNKTSYSVEVPFEVESVEVYAQKQDSNSKVTGTGKKKLREGTNKLDVIVTAEDGTKKTYTINVVRKSGEEDMTPNVVDDSEEKPEKLRLTAISLQNNLKVSLQPLFNSEIFEYTLELENDIESLELSGIPNVDGSKVEIVGNTNLVEGENIITITVKSEGYEDIIYTIKAIRKSEEIEEETQEVSSNPINIIDLDNSYTRNKIIVISSVAGLIIIGIIVILILKHKKRNQSINSSYDDYYNDYINIDEQNDVNENTKQIKDYTSENYKSDIEKFIEYDEEPKRKKGRGKHF